MVTRASCGARLQRFQFWDWWKLSRMLRGLAPNAQVDRKVPMDTRRGFEKIAGHVAFERLRGLLPVQLGDASRVWGAKSFAASPAFGGLFCEEVAQQCGFRTPASSPQEKGDHSGLWLAVVDPDAAVAVPGVVLRAKEEAAGLESSSARASAVISGKLFAEWSGDCAKKSGDTKVPADNALEAGFRRRTSRVGVQNARDVVRA